jgi:hypothetical protein
MMTHACTEIHPFRLGNCLRYHGVRYFFLKNPEKNRLDKAGSLDSPEEKCED